MTNDPVGGGAAASANRASLRASPTTGEEDDGVLPDGPRRSDRDAFPRADSVEDVQERARRRFSDASSSGAISARPMGGNAPGSAVDVGSSSATPGPPAARTSLAASGLLGTDVDDALFAQDADEAPTVVAPAPRTRTSDGGLFGDDDDDALFSESRPPATSVPRPSLFGDDDDDDGLFGGAPPPTARPSTDDADAVQPERRPNDLLANVEENEDSVAEASERIVSSRPSETPATDVPPPAATTTTTTTSGPVAVPKSRLDDLLGGGDDDDDDDFALSAAAPAPSSKSSNTAAAAADPSPPAAAAKSPLDEFLADVDDDDSLEGVDDGTLFSRRSRVPVPDNGGGGLFDEVDAEEERRVREEEERKKREAEEKQKREEEKQKREEEERRRLEEEEERERERARLEQERIRTEQERIRQKEERARREQEEALQRMEDEARRERQFQQQQQQQQQQQHQSPPPSSFYRPHDPQLMMMDDPLRAAADPRANTGAVGRLVGAPDVRRAPVPPPAPSPSSYVLGAPVPSPAPPRPAPPTRPSHFAGAYNRGPGTARVDAAALFASPPSRALDAPLYRDLDVGDPRRVASSGGLFGAPPHWTYAVSCRTGNYDAEVVVRRRFRHFVALEDRLREACPGSVLPPRPDKHESRLIEEGLQSQSPEFAAARATELRAYLVALASHPHAGTTETLRIFLTLHDRLGAAWPEVSGNPLQRLTNASAAAAAAASRSLVGEDDGEDDAGLLALGRHEEARLDAVAQSVVKIDGAIHSLRARGEAAMSAGLETSRTCAGLLATEDPALAASLAPLGTALMRDGKRDRRLAAQASAAFAPFVAEYRRIGNERAAFRDRRDASRARRAARTRADDRSRRLVERRRRAARDPAVDRADLDRAASEASASDGSYADAAAACDAVGTTLAGEIGRLAIERRVEWTASLKIMASAFKEACAERKAVWEATRSTLRRDAGPTPSQAAASPEPRPGPTHTSRAHPGPTNMSAYPGSTNMSSPQTYPGSTNMSSPTAYPGSTNMSSPQTYPGSTNMSPDVYPGSTNMSSVPVTTQGMQR